MAASSAGVGRGPGRYLWTFGISIWGVHALACLVFLPWLFSWAGVVALLAGWVLFGLAINIGYHRLLTHRSLKVPRWLEYGLVVIALCSLQDTPVRWVTHHRFHHAHSDHADDAHSPLSGIYWSHMGWLFRENRQIESVAAYDRYARDILDDRFYRWLERSMLRSFGIYLAHAALFFLAGLLAGWVGNGAAEGLRLGLSLLVWGVLARTVLVWHATWSVNSLTHRFGYRRYETGDDSRNNWFVALVAGGEGWHNNHHWDQVSARHGHRWWEFDLSWTVIWALERLGLATDVIRPRQHRRRTPRNGAAVAAPKV